MASNDEIKKSTSARWKAGAMPREKTVKVSTEKYEALSEALGKHRLRAQAIEGLIELFLDSITDNKYLIFDVLSDPSLLTIEYKKKKDDKKG